MLQWFGRLVDFLGGPGGVLLEILGLVSAYLLDRLVLRRKRIGYRVLYNSRIGLSPETPHDGTDPVESPTPEMRQLMRLLGRLSMVVIRIRNKGSTEIEPDDFETPLGFTFGRRVVWNARISDASTDEVRKKLRDGLRFFPTETRAVGNPAPTRDDLPTVRQLLTKRLRRRFGPPEGPAAEQDVPEPRWHGVRMDGLSLGRRQKAKLVVVLDEPESSEGDITKDMERGGKLRGTGVIEDEGRRGRFTMPSVTGALAAVLTVVLVLGLVFKAEPTAPPDPNIACSHGELRVEGSSVFVPTMKAIADEYVRACGAGTRITTEPNGSIAGVRHVVESNSPNPGALIALSDGKSRDHHNELYAQPIAIVVYHVVVHGKVGLNTVSTKDLRGIYDGTYTDWNQLTNALGPPLPIRIISRGQDSGTRQLFEQRVLETGEGELSSDECLEKDRNPQARVIRCERNSNSEIVQKISAIPGAIGYADAPSIAQARRTNDLTALTLDGRAFDAATAVESGYPFWTVEYLYTKHKPEPGSLTANFIEFTRKHELARVQLTETGFRPCATPQGALELCNLR